MKPKYILVNIGCIECGVSSNIVGVFSDEQTAEEMQAFCEAEFNWRESGENHFEIFEMPEIDTINPEYVK
jgi:hypothetical protein